MSVNSNAFFQNSYPFNMPIGIPGRIADCGFKNTLSPTALENIPAALGVVKPLNVDYQVALPRNNMASSVFSADLILDNVVNMTVNGVAIAPVAFNTFGNSADTMEQVRLEISQIPSISSATLGGVGNRTITIISQIGTSTAVTVGTVTGGLTAATITTTASQSGTFFGVTQAIYNKMNTWIPEQGQNLSRSSGESTPYYAGNPVPTLTWGRIYIQPEDVVVSNSPVYMRVVPTVGNPQVGSFRSDADGGNAVLIPPANAIWREGNGVVGGIAVLELRIP